MFTDLDGKDVAIMNIGLVRVIFI